MHPCLNPLRFFKLCLEWFRSESGEIEFTPEWEDGE